MLVAAHVLSCLLHLKLIECSHMLPLYRDIVRQFIKGTDGFSGAFAECLCGSPNLYQVCLFQEGGGKPWNSVNFICAHDGFSLADLVSYNHKHNLANGEDNNDGEIHNNSWNCGQEGEFADISVKKLRKRQMRNFFLCLMVSQGVPMIYMGDEYGHTKGGNNNTYCHDNYVIFYTLLMSGTSIKPSC
ncbi:hypothetical protein Pint_13948 [Pistacia integerrima]|uniref:Uncharacterized protein n=1 Tax=Pistacia integerrima TaxID=434235 RepID=A0ACC0Y5C3_9ROSI|nr:hypothetical protein Pint_13948 [Pistacia integerrima]